ncbi:hypothetical protein DFS34DRAFT_409543 [Phlyctochytrium arcticum]|nr:hypothetical protein DFS34DRAFT_409543 [Phlyctochytrium arcticum]
MTRHGSSINSGDLNDVLKFTGVALLKEDAVALKKVPSVAGTMPFTWGSNVEHMQTPQTIEWLKNALQFEMDSQVTIEAYHTTKKAHFGFPLSAKVDLRVAVANNSVCFIELKKSVDPQAERQAVAEACLFLRDTTPEISATGVIVLTDLHDFWQVLYFSAAESGASTKKLHVVNVDREKGLGAIKLAVLECTKELYEFGVHVERMDRINREIAEFPNSPLKKRIKLVHLSPESSQLIRMQDLAESEEERSLLRKRLWLSLFADNCEPEEQRTYRDTEQGMRNEWLPMYV